MHNLYFETVHPFVSILYIYCCVVFDKNKEALFYTDVMALYKMAFVCLYADIHTTAWV